MEGEQSQVPAAEPAAQDSAYSQLALLLRAMIGSGRRRQLALLFLGIVVVICLNAVGQIRLNAWQREFYQAVEQRQFPEFMRQLAVFAVIAGSLLVLVVSQTWLQAMANVRLREWLTHDLLDQWLVDGRLYLMRFSGEIGVNPDQRIQQDAQHLAELTTGLLVGLLQSSLLLVSFIGVLWVLSGNVVFNFGLGPTMIPGYMVWCALGFAAGGSALGWWVGRPLVALNAERYAREADFRSAVVRVSENADGIVLEDGEDDERRLLNRPLGEVMALMSRLANGLARLTWVTSGYGWLASVAPIVVAAPAYFGGNMSFGTLMMVVGAFNQVQSSLRWFVDNLPAIADWRATLHRVAAFRSALAASTGIGAETSRIELDTANDDRLTLEAISIALTESCATLDQSTVVIRAGEHVQILGPVGSGKSTLFRALAGMWPWGSGRITLPPRETMAFMPERPYFPVGPLRLAMTYPDEPAAYPATDLTTALKRMGLDRLVPMLDRTERWDQVMTLEEQQRLALARLGLRRPRWAILDDAMSALDEAQHGLLKSLMQNELATTAFVRLGRHTILDGSWDRTVHLIERENGPCLNPAAEPVAVERQPTELSAEPM
jgi:putative ATP-binding cassette transporter